MLDIDGAGREHRFNIVECYHVACSDFPSEPQHFQVNVLSLQDCQNTLAPVSDMLIDVLEERAISKPGDDGQSRLQVGALPFRIDADGSIFVLLISFEETRRWTIPKGWPAKELHNHKAAAEEAFQQAGAMGTVFAGCLGAYEFWCKCTTDFELCEISVYALEVTKTADEWRGKDQCDVRWFSREQAAEIVQEPGLRQIIYSLDRLQPFTSRLAGTTTSASRTNSKPKP